MSADTEDLAIILLGHGSRRPEPAQAMAAVGAELERSLGRGPVRLAFLELESPTLPEAASAAVAAGAREVVVLPFFLHRGVHLEKHVPELVAQLWRDHPAVRFHLALEVGSHPAMQEILRARFLEALATPGPRPAPAELAGA